MIHESGFSINQKEIFEKLFSDYYGMLVCYAQKYTKREDIAEDLVQDLFVSLWEEHRMFPSQATFRFFFSLYIYKKCRFRLFKTPKCRKPLYWGGIEYKFLFFR